MVRILLDEEEIEILYKIGDTPTMLYHDELRYNVSFKRLVAANLIDFAEDTYGYGYYRTNLGTACLENSGKF